MSVCICACVSVCIKWSVEVLYHLHTLHVCTNVGCGGGGGGGIYWCGCRRQFAFEV